jgi:hypothetical protein
MHDIMYETESNYCNEVTLCIAKQKYRKSKNTKISRCLYW